MIKRRCAWANTEQLAAYHDAEWGRPNHDDRYLFEMICLEGAQAGLSWATVLRKRENYRRAFANFEIDRLLRFTPARRERLVEDEGLIRHAGKIASVFTNARAARAVIAEHGSLDEFVWAFDDAADLSHALKREGFRFVGPTICYAFMQAVGMVDDHAPDCFCRGRKRSRRPR